MLIDSHAHLSLKPESAPALLASMKALGIDRTVVVGGGLVEPALISVESSAARSVNFDNFELLKTCDQSAGKLLPFYFANPWIAPEEYSDLGARFYGLKLGPAVHGCRLDTDETRRYLKVAQLHEHPVYLHCLNRDGFRVADFARLARDFSSLTFILGHGGVGHLDYVAVDEIARESNIFYETSGAFKAVIKYACAKLGMHRVLFGTEFPLQSASAELAKIRDLDLTETELGKITCDNISHVLGRPAV